MNKIIVGGEEFKIKAPTIHWNEPNGKSFYESKKFIARNWDLKMCQEKLDIFTLHHANTYNAEITYQVLLQRGLSVNFIIDDDNVDDYATIYQCLDVKDAGYSQKGYNHRGPGVEVSYIPLVNDYPFAYSDINQKKFKVQHHEIIEDVVHHQKFRVYAPTKAQINSVIELCKALKNALPNIDWKFQKDLGGKIIKTTLSNPSGLCCHYHLDRGKIDAIGFPLEEIEKSICKKDEDIYDNL